MRISIITPSYNQGNFIEKTIKSVLDQNHNNFEHIIVDGGSKDCTLAILRKYNHLKWISEPDGGQADAINKGLSMADGEIIGWINSDDYYQDNIFTDVLNNFNDPSTSWIVGNITFCYPNLGISRADISPKITYKNPLKNPDIVRQQGVFFRREILSKVNGLQKEYYMAMDFDLWVRLSKLQEPKMVSKNFAYFVWHSNQKTCKGNQLQQIKEINRILKDNEMPFISRYLFLCKKFFYYLKSIVKAGCIGAGIIPSNYANVPIFKFRRQK